MANLPQGTVTFLFTDIEGSTRLVQELGPAYRDVLERHQALLREAFGRGVEVTTEGDSFFVAFGDAEDAIGGAVAAQRAVAGATWPGGRQLRVRMGLHTGQGVLGGDSYVGVDVHRAARIAAAGHGGQVLVSESTRALVERSLPEGVSLRDLGPHRLKDLAVPERIFQLTIPGLTDDFPALTSLSVLSTNLAKPLTSFVGRVRELDEVRALVGTQRLVTVIGTGGTGKTRLMCEAAAGLLDQWADGVWLVELAPISDADQVVPAIARAVGAREEPGRPLVDAVVDYLQAKRLLLLLDNCEHLIAPVAQLTEQLLGAAPTLSIVATSREALGVAGERLFQIPSLSVPTDDDSDPEHGPDDAWRDAAAASDAVRLFTARAGAALPGFALDAAGLRDVVEICRRLDGIPLAIELAAARVALLSVGDIAARLSDRFRLLTGGRRTAVPRQQTLEAAIDWSWELLTDAERRTLCRLSVFAGGWTVEAAAAVVLDPSSGAGDATFDALELLGRLIAKSLVMVDRGAATTRYRQLETIRQYARERLVAAGDADELRDRHLAYFLAVAEAAAPRLTGPAMAVALRQLDPDLDNFLAAVEWGFEADVASALRICLAMAVYGRSRSLSEGFEILTRAATAVDRLPDAETSILAARLLAAAANAAWMVGSAPLGMTWADRAMRIADAAADPRARAEARNAKAMTSLFVGQEEGVLEWADEAAGIAEELGDWSSIGFIQAGISQWEAERGNVPAAAARLAVATAAANRSGSPEVIAFTALSRGRVAGFSMQLDEAREAFATAIAAYAEIEDNGLVLVARSDFAHALRHNGATDEALALYRETLHDWMHAGNRGAVANQVESFALLLVGNDSPAAVRLLAAATAAREAADAPMLSFEQAEFDGATARLRNDLDATEFETAWEAGRRLSLDEAVTLALATTAGG
ncbi:MAG: adenylate/guanylate cyclase domain-containing protein [Chloroflexota bacterium]